MEIAVGLVFILYVALPVQTPAFLVDMINSPLGMVSMFIITLYLFFYVNPILGVLYILVAFELLRRSQMASGKVPIVYNTDSEEVKMAKMVSYNPPKTSSLEEEMVHKMAPSKMNFINVSTSTFQPVQERVVGASLI
jgi:hypothetical protein